MDFVSSVSAMRFLKEKQVNLKGSISYTKLDYGCSSVHMYWNSKPCQHTGSPQGTQALIYISLTSSKESQNDRIFFCAGMHYTFGCGQRVTYARVPEQNPYTTKRWPRVISK